MLLWELYECHKSYENIFSYVFFIITCHIYFPFSDNEEKNNYLKLWFDTEQFMKNTENLAMKLKCLYLSIKYSLKTYLKDAENWQTYVKYINEIKIYVMIISVSQHYK